MAPTLANHDRLFVMGDHRSRSADSRHWGMVPKKYIGGRIALR